MEFLQEYQKYGVQGLKEQIDINSQNQTQNKELVTNLQKLTKEKDVRHDIEAQKLIAEQLYEIEAFEEANKLCKRLLIQKPNDSEVQDLFSKIRTAKSEKNSNSSEKNLLEKNQDMLQSIEREVNKLIYGQEGFVQNLSNLVQKSLLTSEPMYHYKEAVLVSSPKSQGINTTIKSFFNYVYQYNLIDSELVQVIDLSQYDTNHNVVEIFFVDIYNAFMGESRVTIFKNVDQCPLELMPYLNNLLNNGSIHLDGRYVSQDGMLVKVAQMLVSGSFDSIEATGQYLFFHSYEKIEKALETFTESSRSKFTYKLSLPSLTEKDTEHLFEGMLDDYLEKVEKHLGVLIEYEPSNFNEFVKYYFKQGGAIDLKTVVNIIYQQINNYFIHDIEKTENVDWNITYENNEVFLKSEEKKHTLLTVNKTENNLQQIQEKIDRLIGLQEVKNSLYELQIYIANRKRRTEKGNESEKLPLHFLFKGNPGTGKTTIARLVSEYLKAIGFLREGHLIEVDRSDLVGQYIGHTAIKTMQKINAAIGGVLFIDEAYSLARGSESDFGREAIDTIVKAMEDYNGELVVIFAGYPKEMDDLIEVNPGLRSRITQSFFFNDYTNEELVQIAVEVSNAHGYMIEAEAKEQLPTFFGQHQIKGKTDAGNGRLARQVVENAIKKQSVRLVENDLVGADIDILCLEDFGLEKKEEFNLEANLKDIVGLDHIKELVRTLHKQESINKKRRELNSNFKSDQSLNYIYTGNPGTGKTTIARIIAELFKNIGILKKGHLVEVSRSDLVAGYIGQTAMKTEKVFMEALGGVLFIDEAYSLASESGSDFGAEAIDTLIKLIEDYRGDIIVILAGYEKQMNKLLETNPGIKSRFSNTLHFPDYNEKELFLIALHLFNSKGFELKAAAESVLASHLKPSQETFEGNGRYVRNMVEEVIRLQSNRLYELTSITEESLLEILPEDIHEFFIK